MGKSKILENLILAMASGKVQIIDLTHTLEPSFPVKILPPEFGQCARFRMEEVSNYDYRGPAWKWNNISCSEHTGTHFGAPSYWISGRDLPHNSVDDIDPSEFMGMIEVIDCSKEAAKDDDFELTPEFIQAWEKKNGVIAEDSWVFMRTDWSKRIYTHGTDYINLREDGAHFPGPTAQGMKFLVEKRNIRGFGTETIGPDAGQGGQYTPPNPGHYYLYGAGKCSLQCLANLHKLPPKGALLIAAPLKIKKGTGSPLRVLALVVK